MKERIVNIKKIKDTLRCDGSYHIAEINLYSDIIESHSSHTLDYFCEDIFTSGRNKRVYSTKNYGYPYLSNSDVVSINPFNNCNYASKKYGYDEKALLKEGMILTGRVGVIGQTSLVPKFWEKYKCMGSDNIIRIQIKKQYYNGFIYAYLASKVGNLSFKKHSTGGVQPFITDKMVGSLPIPNFPEAFQLEVDNLIQESARLREEATDALEEAVEYFNNKFKISSITQKVFNKKIKDLSFSFAAYNNNIEVDTFIDTYRSHSIKIENVTSKVFAPPLFKHIYLSKDNGFPFMTGSELNKYNLRYYRWLSPKGVKDINDYIVRKGTLLLYKSGTTDGGILGNVFIADDKLDGCCLSDHVIRIVFNDVKMAYWAFAFFRSKGAIRMLLRLSTGTMIPFITSDRISQSIIPAPDEYFERIVSLVDKYVRYNSQSKFNENKAISMIETEIEKWKKN